MNVNYDDERFTQVEQEKQSELDKYNQTYDNLIAERNELTQQQQDYVDSWKDTQTQIANDNLNHQLDLYNQEKEKAEKDYQKEAKASYIDYQKEVDKYGVSRENVVSNGLSNSGYAESSKVDMYNTYQNRVATARESLNNIKLEFDNAIKEAQLSNNATLAELALQQMQQKLNIALEGFNYKDTATQNKLNWQNQINNTYYDRYKDVEAQINYENEQAEAIRQYNEQMAYQKELDRIAQQQWEKEYALQQQQLALQRQQAAEQKAYYESLMDGNGEESENDKEEPASPQNKSSGTITYGGKTGYSSLADAVTYLKNNGVSGVSTASKVDDLIAKGYLTTQTVNGKVYYFPNANVKSSTSNSKSSSSTSSSSSNKSSTSNKSSNSILSKLSKLLQFV